jgi:hypothetical protein
VIPSTYKGSEHQTRRRIASIGKYIDCSRELGEKSISKGVVSPASDTRDQELQIEEAHSRTMLLRSGSQAAPMLSGDASERDDEAKKSDEPAGLIGLMM